MSERKRENKCVAGRSGPSMAGKMCLGASPRNRTTHLLKREPKPISVTRNRAVSGNSLEEELRPMTDRK
jgi:hypothetical protein